MEATNTKCKSSGFTFWVWGGYQVGLFPFQQTETQLRLAQTKREWIGCCPEPSKGGSVCTTQDLGLGTQDDFPVSVPLGFPLSCLPFSHCLSHLCSPFGSKESPLTSPLQLPRPRGH